MASGAQVIIDPKTARILVDPMRRELLRLLAERSMTENELAAALGLSDPSVGHHLRILQKAGLIRVQRREPEEHGILQKYYEPSAAAYFIDGRKMPLEIERYFMPVSLERARGIISAVNAMKGRPATVGTKELEAFAKLYSAAVIDVASKYSKHKKEDREVVIGKIYLTALKQLLSGEKALLRPSLAC